METSTQLDASTEVTDVFGMMFGFAARAYLYAETIGFGVCLITNIFGNTLTLVAMRKFSFLQSITYIALISLTISDLLMSFYILLRFLLRFDILDASDANQFAVVSLFGRFILFSAMLHVLLIALDRFIAVVFPYFYSSNVTKVRLIAMSLTTWAVSFVFTAIYVTMNSLIAQGNNLVFLFDIFLFLIIVVLLLVTHGKVACVARSKRTQVTAGDVQDLSDGNKTKNKKIDDAYYGWCLFAALVAPDCHFFYTDSDKSSDGSSYLRKEFWFNSDNI